MKQGNYVLWLTSWYPCAANPYNGDFIQRQAQALSAHLPMVVMHVELVENEPLPPLSITRNDALEERIFYTEDRKNNWWQKAGTHRRYLNLFKEKLLELFAEKGLPMRVHVHIPVKAGNLGLWLKKRFGLPYLVSEHYGIYNRLAPDNWFNRSPFFQSQTRRILKAAEQIVVVSEALGRQMKTCVGIDDFSVIPNVVNTSVFYPELSARTEQGQHRLLHASTMNEPKNAEGILRAFQQAWAVNPQIELLMAGLAPDSLIAAAKSLPSAASVHFVGMLPQADLAKMMRSAAAFVLFSHYENLPCVLLEAKCSGLPLIASRVGGIPEIVSPTDWLVDPGDELALCNAMLEATNGLSTLSSGEVEAAVAKYSYDAVAKQFLQLYNLS